MYDCKQCNSSGFVRVPKRASTPNVTVFAPATQMTVSDGYEEAPCPNCGGLRQRMEYGYGVVEVQAYMRAGMPAAEMSDYDAHNFKSAARRAFEALLHHGAFKLERHDPPEEERDPLAKVEYRARMAVIMPAALNYFDDQLEAARQEGREQILAEAKRQQADYEKQGGGGSIGALVMRGLISAVREQEYRARQKARMTPPSNPLPGEMRAPTGTAPPAGGTE